MMLLDMNFVKGGHVEEFCTGTRFKDTGKKTPGGAGTPDTEP